MSKNKVNQEQQQNVFPLPLGEAKHTAKRESNLSDMSEEDVLANSCWKTNLMIDDSEERGKRREKGRKNTSFQNKIINEHVWAIVKSICQINQISSILQARQICEEIESNEAYFKEGIKEEKIMQFFNENTYLTENEKEELFEKFRFNFENYQILLKTTTRLKAVAEYNEELTFIIIKTIDFILANYELKYRKYDEKFMAEEVPNRINDLVKGIVEQENVKVINPEYFYNSNEGKYMKIIQVCFYSIFCIKLGLTDNKYLVNEERMMELE